MKSLRTLQETSIPNSASLCVCVCVCVCVNSLKIRIKNNRRPDHTPKDTKTRHIGKRGHNFKRMIESSYALVYEIRVGSCHGLGAACLPRLLPPFLASAGGPETHPPPCAVNPALAAAFSRIQQTNALLVCGHWVRTLSTIPENEFPPAKLIWPHGTRMSTHTHSHTHKPATLMCGLHSQVGQQLYPLPFMRGPDKYMEHSA
jgi:hypothetical protein